MSKQDTFVEFMSYWRQIFVHCKLSEHFAIHFQSEVNISLDHLSHKRWQMILLLANLMIKEMSIHISENANTKLFENCSPGAPFLVVQLSAAQEPTILIS